MFEEVIKIGLNAIMFLGSKTVVFNELEWITSFLKALIRKRQKALNSGNV